MVVSSFSHLRQSRVSWKLSEDTTFVALCTLTSDKSDLVAVTTRDKTRNTINWLKVYIEQILFFLNQYIYLHRVMNATARFEANSEPHDHPSDAPREQHWLPFEPSIKYKLFCIDWIFPIRSSDQYNNGFNPICQTGYSKCESDLPPHQPAPSPPPSSFS